MSAPREATAARVTAAGAEAVAVRVTAPDAEAVAVLVTAPDAETGQRIARQLVEERLAACVNVLAGVTSVYRWEGAVEEGAEVLLVIKTRATRLEPVAARVKALHPYALPEVVALPIVGGDAAYLDWLLRESSG